MLQTVKSQENLFANAPELDLGMEVLEDAIAPGRARQFITGFAVGVGIVGFVVTT